MKIGVIIQARYNSVRLPGKVLMNLPFQSGITILEHIVKRLRKSEKISEIILATSDQIDDELIVDETERINVKLFRGSKENVLERFVEAGKKHNLDVVVRMTGDNPIVFTDIIDKAIKKHIDGNYDYTYSKGLPLGTNLEITNQTVLSEILHGETSNEDREHVTYHIKRFPEKYKILELDSQEGEKKYNYRFTIDYPSDYAFMNIVFNHLEKSNYEYDLKRIMEFMSSHKWIADINDHNFQKKQYSNYSDEVADAIKLLDFYGFEHVKNFLTRKDVIF